MILKLKDVSLRIENNVIPVRETTLIHMEKGTAKIDFLGEDSRKGVPEAISLQVPVKDIEIIFNS